MEQQLFAFFGQHTCRAVTGEPSLWGVHSPSSGGDANLAEVQPSSRRSLCLMGKHHQYLLYFSPSDMSAPLGADVLVHHTQSATLCISTSQPDPSHPSQSDRTGPLLDPCGNSQQESPGLSPYAGIFYLWTRGDLPPAPRPHSAHGLNLDAAGLPEHVIDTIQSARASSTHSYSGKSCSVVDVPGLNGQRKGFFKHKGAHSSHFFLPRWIWG